MRTLNELMDSKWLVGSYAGHAIFWNHSSTFSVYSVSDSGRVTELDVYTRYAPDGLSEAQKIRWAVFTGRELAAELGGSDE